MDGLYEGVEAVKNESEVDYDAPLYKDQQDSTEPYTEDSAEPADDAVEPRVVRDSRLMGSKRSRRRKRQRKKTVQHRMQNSRSMRMRRVERSKNP